MSDLASDSYNKRQEHLRTLGDMSLELSDENFNVQVFSYDDFKGDIKVTMQKKSKPSPEEEVDYSIGQLVIKFKE